MRNQELQFKRENLIVTKFGGSSMADSESVRQVIDIINCDFNRQIVVVSAPGRNNQFQTKVTDLLIGYRFDEVFKRFEKLGQELGWEQSEARIRDVRQQLIKNPAYDFRLSRGEYLTAQMLADLTGSRFIDAGELLVVNQERTVNQASYQQVQASFDSVNTRVIVPGFYGRSQKGWIRTLSRDGSDVTGAVLARGCNAAIYEIFSDTSGLFSADPNRDSSAKKYDTMTFDEADRLSQTSKALHAQVIGILRGTTTAINYRSTFQPENNGTWIR